MTMLPGWTIYESPIGPLTLVAGPKGIANIYFPRRSPRLSEAAKQPMPEATGQLDAYFAGERRVFELDFDLRGAPFQLEVWRQLLEIPYGKTTTYGDLARELGYATLARAVGRAVGHNPLSVIVPCHRVVGKDGQLTGYAGGLERKRFLLELEAPPSVREEPTPSLF